MPSSSNTFSYDFLNIYDGNDIFATEIASLSGILAEVVMSSGPNIFLNFLSDDTETSSGFKIQYWAGKIRFNFIIPKYQHGQEWIILPSPKRYIC